MPITVTHAKSDTIANYTGTITQFNSTGGTVTVAATDLVRPIDWNSAHAGTLQITGSEIGSLFTFGAGLTMSTDTSGITAGIQSVPFYEPFFGQNTNSTLSTQGAGTWYLDPLNLPYGLGSGQLNILAADAAGFKNGAVYSSGTTATITRNQTLQTVLALWKVGTGANLTRIESIWSRQDSILATWALSVNSTTAGGGTTTGEIISNALTLSFPAQWDISGGVTYSTTAQTGTTSTSVSTAASTFADNLITGAIAYVSGSKMLPLAFATTLAGGDYYLGIMISSTSSSNGTNMTAGTMMSTQSIYHVLEFVNQAYKRAGQSVSNSSSAILPFHGSVATTTSAPISTLATSDMRNYAANNRLYWNYLQSSY